MSHGGHHEASEPARRSRWRLLLWPGSTSGWAVVAALTFVAAGLLATTSAVNAHGTDLRGGGNDSLIEIVSTERSKVEQLQHQTSVLQSQVDALSKAVSGQQIAALQRRIDAVEHTAQATPLHGRGLVVVLRDAPRGETVPPGTDPNLLLVHQQDIQAVANALWAGGAAGVSLQGHRLISTTGIKCVGNTVVLEGVPYAPPYRLVAIGDPAKLFKALLASPEVTAYRDYVKPPYNLGWSVRPGEELSVPGYTGSVTLEYARPAQGSH